LVSGLQNPAFEGDEPIEDSASRVFSRQSTRSTLVSPTASTRLMSTIQATEMGEKTALNSDRLSPIWIKQCIGDIIPPNAVKARVEKLCRGVWDTVMGPDDG